MGLVTGPMGTMGNPSVSLSQPFVFSSPPHDQHRTVAEDKFPEAWTKLDASFDQYLDFAITKSLAKFPKPDRKDVSDPSFDTTWCWSYVLVHVCRQTQHLGSQQPG